MKPIVIIAIAVVCSVVAVLGVLVVLQEITTYQSQVAFDEYQTEVLRIEALEREIQQAEYDQNRVLCVKLFPNTMGFGDRNPYRDCLDYGIDFAIESMVDDCSMHGAPLSVERAVCLLEKLKIIKERIGYSP